MKILKSPLLYLGALATVSAQAAARADASNNNTLWLTIACVRLILC